MNDFDFDGGGVIKAACLSLFACTALYCPGLLAETENTRSQLSQEDASSEHNPERYGVYVDQLITGEAEEDESVEAVLLKEQSASGLYDFSALFQYYTLNGASDAEDKPASSLSLYGARQTRQFGNLYSELHLTRFSDQGIISADSGSDPFNSTDLHGAFVVRQTEFPLTEKVQMDNTLGVHRPLAGWTRYRASRLSVLTPTLFGASSSMTAGQHTFRASVGDIGRLRGPLSQAYFSEHATAAILGDTWDSGRNWLLAGDLWNVSGSSDETENRTGYSLLAAHVGSNKNRPDKLLQVIGTDKGSQGVTGYIVKQYSRFTHELGAYAIGPDMNWLARDLSDDQNGIYLRSDYDKGRTHLNSSLEWVDSQIHSTKGAAARKGLLANLGWNFRQSYASTFGATGYYRGYREGAGEDQIFGSAVNSRIFYTYRHNRRFRSRWEATENISDLSRDAGAVTTQSLEYGLTFERSESSQLELALGAQRQTDDFSESWNPTADIRGNAPLPHGGWIDGSLGYSLYSVHKGDGQANWHAQMHMEYPFATNWAAGLQINFNQVYYDRSQEPTVLDPFDTPDSRRATSVLLTVRYRTNGGTPVSPLGQSADSLGSGSVRGVVFMDENNDGVQQGDEKTASGVEVYLDGRYLAKTDASGYFRFPLVATGKHSIFILEETLPLPWEAEQNNVPLDVSLRNWTKIAVPLKRIR